MSRIELVDGSTWPDPRQLGDAAWCLRNAPTRYAEFEGAAVIAAYRVLCGPGGAKKLKLIRRALRRAKKE